MKIYIKDLRMLVDGAGPATRKCLTLIRKKRTGKLTKKGWPEIERIPTAMYTALSPTRLWTMTGLLDRLLGYPGSKGAEVIDLRGPVTPLEAPSDVEWRPGQEQALNAMLRLPQGRLVHPTGSGKTFLMEQLCGAAKGLVTVLCTTRQVVLKDIIRRLKISQPDIRLRRVDGSHTFREGFGVYVVSDRSLHKLPEGWEPDIFVFDEAHGAAAPGVFPQMRRFHKCRMYGLTATDTGRSDGADLGIEALFGPRICEMDYQEAESLGLVVPMHVYMMQIRGAPLPERITEPDLAYFGYVVNGVRNENMLAGADVMARKGYPKQLLTTRTTEHTLHLAQMRPDIVPVYRPVKSEKWQEFVSMGLVDSTRMSQSPNVEAIIEDLRKGVVQRIAGTTCLRDGVDVDTIQVIVRMDGFSGNIASTQFSGRGTRIHATKPHGLLLDSTDEFGDRMAGASQRRVTAYREKGWVMHEWQTSTGG